MSISKGLTSIVLCGILLSSPSSIVLADGANVVTLGKDLTEEQKTTVLKYFGVKESEVILLEVNNDEERKYLEGVASDAQIGTRTYSCSYVEPTKKDSGIKVKTVNLTYVTSNMIASTLATCGIKDANVIAMSPMPVSGTGALTGVMKAFEDATGEKLDEDKKEIASEELVVTGDIADTIGADKATGIVNDIKTEVIKENTSDTNQIAQIIVNVTNNYDASLTDTQIEELKSLMTRIGEQNYDYSDIKETLEHIGSSIEEKLEAEGITIDKGFWESVKDTVSGWMDSVGDLFAGVFNDIEEELGILGNTNDEILGEDVIVDATEEEALDTIKNETKGFFEKIWGWFEELFNNGDDLTTEIDIDQENDEIDIDADTKDDKTEVEIDDKNDVNDSNDVENEKDNINDLSDTENNDEDETEETNTSDISNESDNNKSENDNAEEDDDDDENKSEN